MVTVGIGLVDVVGYRAAGVVVVARDIREGPGISGVAAGGGVRRAAQIQPGQGLTLNTQTLARGRVRVAIVGHAVTGDGAVGIGLVDYLRHVTVTGSVARAGITSCNRVARWRQGTGRERRLTGVWTGCPYWDRAGQNGAGCCACAAFNKRHVPLIDWRNAAQSCRCEGNAIAKGRRVEVRRNGSRSRCRRNCSVGSRAVVSRDRIKSGCADCSSV